MHFGDETPEHTGKFTAEKLPDGMIVPTQWELVGMTRARPQGEAVRDTGVGGAGTTGSGKATAGYHIAPRHRKIVRAYYDKKGAQ